MLDLLHLKCRPCARCKSTKSFLKIYSRHVKKRMKVLLQSVRWCLLGSSVPYEFAGQSSTINLESSHRTCHRSKVTGVDTSSPTISACVRRERDFPVSWQRQRCSMVRCSGAFPITIDLGLAITPPPSLIPITGATGTRPAHRRGCRVPGMTPILAITAALRESEINWTQLIACAGAIQPSDVGCLVPNDVAFMCDCVIFISPYSDSSTYLSGCLLPCSRFVTDGIESNSSSLLCSLLLVLLDKCSGW